MKVPPLTRLYELNGRVFQPYGDDREMYFAYARPKDEAKWADTQRQYDMLSKAFVIDECDMGNDPKEVLRQKMETELQQPVETPKWLTMHYLERDPSMGVLVGYYRDEKHLQWILGNNDKGSLVYNVRLKVKGEEERAGAHTATEYDKKNVRFVLLYTDKAEDTGEYHVFHVKDTAKKVSGERMEATWYPSEVKGNYFFFRFDEEVSLGKIIIKTLLPKLREKHRVEFGVYAEGEPMFTTAKELIEYRDGML